MLIRGVLWNNSVFVVELHVPELELNSALV